MACVSYMAAERSAASASRRLTGFAAVLLTTAALVAVAALLPSAAHAQDATWRNVPGSPYFNTAANWTPATVPTGTAFFGTSNTTALSFSANTTIGGWTFNAGASNYSFSNGQAVVFTGAGIVVNGGSATIVNNNFVLFSVDSSAGNTTIINKAGAFNNFVGASTAGNAIITNDVGGSIRLGNFATAGNAVITNNGLLQFQDFSTAGNAAIINNSLLRFVDTSDPRNATIVNGSAGVVDFSIASGNNNDRKYSAGSIGGGGNFYLGSNQLTVGGNNLSTVVSGAISDCGAVGVACLFGGSVGGSLVKAGAGSLSLTGVNTYTGPTNVNGGILSVNGSIATSSLTMVNAGGTLAGTGTVGNTWVSGGTLSPGNSIGTLNVSGNLAFTTAATYLIEVSPTASDLTRVSGTAALAGVVQVVSPISTYKFNQPYTILSASGGLGGTQFSALVVPSFITAALSYSSTNVSLTLALGLEQLAGLNANQRAVGSAIDRAANGSGSLPPVFANLLNLAPSALPGVLSQLSGETATGAQQTTFEAMTQFLDILLGPFIGGRSDGTAPAGATTSFAEESASAYASEGRRRSGREQDAYGMITKAAPRKPVFDPRWSVWTAGFGGSQTTDGNPAQGSNATTSRLGGAAVGADYRFSPSTLAGFAFAGGGTNFSVANSGSGRSDLFQAGAFVKHAVGPAYISGALAYGWQDITADRTVTIAGVDRLHAQFNANAFSGRVEGGYRFVAPWTGGIGITPYAAGQFTTFDLPAYAEQVVSGANNFALVYAAKNVTAPRSEFGLRTDTSSAVANGILTLRGRAAWAHDFNPDRSVAATFQTLPGASFVVNGAQQAADAALVTGSAEIKWLNGWSAAATFDGEFSSVTRSYAGKGVVRYAW